MRIDHLRLKGVTCFAGDVNLDFTQIPPGLIAIVGPNGSGKTTLMESMAAGIYRQMPTRGQVLDYATGKDSYIDVGVTFDQAGSFRARLNLDGVKAASDAVLERVVDGLSTRLNDGKVTTFDRAVAEIFPPFDALLASAFAAQNRAGSFATRNKTERKDLFYNLLGLHQLDGFATTARASVAVLEKRLAELRGRRDALAPNASDDVQTQLQQQVASFESDLAEAQQVVRDLNDQFVGLDRDVDARRAAVARLASLITDRARLEAAQSEQYRQRTHAAGDLTSVDVDEARESGTASARVQSTIRQHEGFIANLVGDEEIRDDERRDVLRVSRAFDILKAEKQERIDKNRGLKDRAAVIRNAVAIVQAARAAAGRLQEQLDATIQRHGEDDIPTHIAAAEQTIRDTRAGLLERERVRRSSGLLSTVPCGGIGPYAACQFLHDAAAARARLAELEAQDLDAALVAADQRLTALRTTEASQRQVEATLRTGITAETRSAEAHQEDAELLPYLEAAEQRITELEAAITLAEANVAKEKDTARDLAQSRIASRDAERTRLNDAIAVARTDGDAELEAIGQRSAALRRQRSQRLADLDASLADLKTQLAATAGTADEHVQAELALTEAMRLRSNNQLQTSGADVSQARLEEQVTIVRRRLEECQQRRAELDRATGLVTALESDLIEWQALAQVMGRDGLPVLEIDAAGPGVSAEANDLLQASFGGRFVVELVTQEAKTDGKGMKEVFELKVYDHERGGEERDLSDLSGGEQVVVDEALKSAIALFVNRRNDRPIRTVWRDETTGALDPENAQRYVAMLRRLHERAGLHHLFFVSHNPDVSAQADAQLQVADGKVTVAYPPFAPASQAAA